VFRKKVILGARGRSNEVRPLEIFLGECTGHKSKKNVQMSNKCLDKLAAKIAKVCDFLIVSQKISLAVWPLT